MNYSLFFKPLQLIERAALQIRRNRRFKKLEGTVAKSLQLGHIDSLELLEIIAKDDQLPANAVIYDIGSNTGTWTLLAKAMLSGASIEAFEPLPEHNKVFKSDTVSLQNVRLHEYCVGNENTTANLNVSSYSDSSSLLSATDFVNEQYNISKVRDQQVEIKRLNDLIACGALPIPQIIKLDIQGYELEALKGLDRYIFDVKYIICEVSFKEYYTGQPLFLDIATYLAQFGLQMFAFGYNTPIGQELNQIDVLFKSNKY